MIQEAGRREIKIPVHTPTSTRPRLPSAPCTRRCSGASGRPAVPLLPMGFCVRARSCAGKAMGFLADHAAARGGRRPRRVCPLKPGERACRRLAGLLKWHAAMQKRSIDDYDEGAPVQER